MLFWNSTRLCPLAVAHTPLLVRVFLCLIETAILVLVYLCIKYAMYSIITNTL